MRTVEQGLRLLHSKILSLHQKVDPNLSHQFYSSRFESFHQPELIISDLLFVFEGLSEKVEQILTRCPTHEYIDRMEKVMKMQEEQRRSQERSGVKKDVNQGNARMSMDLTKGLQEKDMNRAAKRTSAPKKHRSAYVTKFDIDRVTPRARNCSREKRQLFPIAIQQVNPQEPPQQNNPFEDCWIYQHIKTEASRVNRISTALKDGRAKRNARNFSISIIKNSLKMC